MEIISADHKIFHEGDRAFNYYDMEVGVIGAIDSYAQPDTMKGQTCNTPVEDWNNHWFAFISDKGGQTSLDGSRICSIQFAVAKGWLNADHC